MDLKPQNSYKVFKNIQNYDIVHEQLITDQTLWKQYRLINTCRSIEDISSSRQTFLYREEPEELFLTNSPTSYGPAEMLSADSISNILEISLSSLPFSLSLRECCPNVRTIKSSWDLSFSRQS